VKNVLITGAAGFLGSHLAQRFINNGDFVIGVDNFSTALGVDAIHFTALQVQKHFEFYRMDIRDLLKIGTLIARFKPSLILNFACPASPPRYQAEPIQTLMTSVQGLNNVLSAVRLACIRPTIIHASTSEVYGDPEMSPQPETYFGRVNSYGPRSCYDEGKRAAEALCFDYANLGMDIRPVRIFNTYGPHMDPDDGRVVSNFICQMLRDEPMTIYGDGEQTRSFCYVDDLVEGIYRVSELPVGVLNGPINLGNPNEFTIKELAFKVAKALGKKPQITFDAFPINDPLQRKPDITLAKQFLNGWGPKVQLDDGLPPTIEWFKNLLEK